MKAFRRIAAMTLVLAMLLSLIPLSVSAAGTLTASDANIGLTWTDASNSAGSANWLIDSNNVITATATGYKVAGVLSRTITTTLTITNNYTKAKTLSFTYTLTSGSVTSNDGVMTNGAYSKEVEAGGSVVITLTSPKGLSTGTLTISGIMMTGSGEVTSTFLPSENGTYTVDGTAITESTEISRDESQTYTLAATAKSGYQFFGWWSNSQNKYVAYANPATLTFSEDPQLTARFVASTVALFGVGSAKFDNLTEASAYAANASEKTVVLLNDGMISGDHTIPAGVTLLIPYDESHTLITNTPVCTDVVTEIVPVLGTKIYEQTKWVSPTPFRTLTLAENATINVNGAISVAGRHSSATGSMNYVQPGGGVHDKCGYINLGANSLITINSGASLYAWGYVIGSGEVLAKSGSKIYENFQFMGFRGGTCTSSIVTDKRVFPLTQYYVQNIETKVTYEAGAEEYLATAIFMSKQSFSSVLKFIGEGGMFVPTSGTFTKQYIGSTDRLHMSVDGDFTLSAIKMGIGGIDIDSSDFTLPITNNMTLEVLSGTSTISQDIELLPGAELYVSEGATIALSSTESHAQIYSGGFNVIAYDYDEWTYGMNADGSVVSKNYVRSYNGDRIAVLPFANSRTYDRTNADLKDVVVDINGTVIADGFLYTTAGGAEIISTAGTGKIVFNNGAGNDEYGQRLTQDGDGNPVYYSIPIYPAWLKNADGSYTKTEDAGNMSVYHYTNGTWAKIGGDCKHSYNAVVTDPTCTTAGYTTYTCEFCGDTYNADPVEAGHKYTTATVEPTCTEDGKTTYTCSACGDTYEETIAALGHDYKATVTAPTCTEGGFTTYTCAICGDSYTADETEALGHTYEAVVTAPTCVDGGYTTYTCVCGDSYTADETEALGHSYEAVITAPTCTEAGYTTYTCTCGDTYTADEVEALGHTEIIDEAIAPTCTETGLTEGKHCESCGEIIVAQEAVDALGHSYEAIVTAPTCTEAGFTTYTCTCGDSYIADEIAALGHSYAYTDNGEDHTVTCANCDYSATEAHSYEDGICICESKLVAAIGEQNFTSLASAVATAQSGDEIVLLSDITLNEKLTVDADDEIILDLNGKTLTTYAVDSNYDVVIKGSLTIKDSGEGGKVIISGVYGFGVSTIAGASLTICGGTYIHEGDYLIGSWGTTVIEGGTFEAGYCALNGFDGTVNVMGGTFSANGEDNILLAGNVSLTGGIYDRDVSEYCADGYYAQADENGMYAVAEVPAIITYPVEGGNIYIERATGLVIDADETITSADIPETVAGVTVVGIGTKAFYYCKSLETVTIPETVTSIGDYGFYYCSALKEIDIPDGVSEIGSYAFNNCHTLTKIEVPSAMTEIKKDAFSRCNNLETVIIPDGIKTIGQHAFYNCPKLTNINIPNGVETIGSWALALTGIVEIVIPDSVTSFGDSMFYECNNLTSATLSAEITTIPMYTFYDCDSLTGYEIPDRITAIGHSAFGYNDNLEWVTIPEGVTAIDGNAFSYSAKLKSIVIPDSVKTVGSCAFAGCTGLESVQIGKGVESFGMQAFGNNPLLTAFEVDEANENFCDVDGILFSKDEIELVYYPGGIAGEYVIPETVNAVNAFAFYSASNLTSITISDHVESIGMNAFTNCTALETVIIGEGIESIDDYMFAGCTAMKTVTLPASIKTIGDGAFSGTWQVTDVYYGSTEEDWALVDIHSSNNFILNATIHFVEFYTVTWNVDGTLTEQTYQLGEMPEFTGATGKASDGCTAYEFVGWDSEIVAVCEDVTYTAVYEERTEHVGVVTDAAVAPTCTETGLSEGSHCEGCGEVLVAQAEVAALGHSNSYTNNGENHSIGCENCDLSETADHEFVDGTCICGATEAAEPKYEYSEKLATSMSITVGAEMQVSYTILNARIKNYESFYVEITKEVAGGESITTVYSLDENNLTDMLNPNTGAHVGYYAIYTGIRASQMGDGFSATLYAVAADGTIYYGPTNASSIKSFLYEKIVNEATLPELKTLAVDMLNYGAAAQVYFGYNAENLVNADLTEEQKALGTQEIPAAVNTSGSTGSGGAIIPNVTLESKVVLYVNCRYEAKEDSNLVVVIKDMDGNVIDEVTPKILTAKICQAAYSNVGAKQMRQPIRIEMYDNGVLVTQTLTWSIESYVAQTRANTNASEALLNAVNAMLTYGDSAAAYLTASGQ